MTDSSACMGRAMDVDEHTRPCDGRLGRLGLAQ